VRLHQVPAKKEVYLKATINFLSDHDRKI